MIHINVVRNKLGDIFVGIYGDGAPDVRPATLDEARRIYEAHARDPQKGTRRPDFNGDEPFEISYFPGGGDED